MNASGKSLIILTPGFPANEEDSACLPWMQNIVRNLCKSYPGLSITVMSLQYPYSKKPYKWEGITVIPFGGANKGGLTKLVLRNKVSRKLNQFYRQKEFAGILSFWYGECARAGHLFAKRKGQVHFCWIAGQDAKKENTFPAKLNIKAENLVAGSDFLRDHFTKNHHVKPGTVIVPGVDPSPFGDNISVRDIDLLAVGSLIPLKQYEVFIEVARSIATAIPNIKAVLIGKGPEMKKISDLINNYSLQQNVYLAGELPYTEVLQYMKRAKVFLHPSSYEGFGCVCTEALYAGASVVRFTKPMEKEMKNTVTVNSVEEMVTATKKLLSQNSPAISTNEYPIENTVRSIARLFGL